MTKTRSEISINVTNMKKDKNIKNGFTLIEVLISTAIFVVLIATVVSTFGLGSDLQNKTLAIRESSQNARFIIEAIARDVRLADSFRILDDGKTIEIYKENETITYSIVNDIETNKGVIAYSDGVNNENLNGESLDISYDNSNFSGVDIDSNEKVQSYVKINIEFGSDVGKSNKNKETYSENVETTVSTRAYNKGYSGKITSDETAE